MTKVCHISTVHRWNDIRIFRKQCVSLAAQGYETHLIVQAPQSSLEEGVHIHALRSPKNRADRALKLTKEALEQALALDADIYQVHDPELLPTALRLKRAGKTVLYDAHENVPASIEDKEWIPFRPLRKLIAALFARYERWVVGKLDGVISVAPPLLDRFDHPMKLVLRNLPILAKFEQTPLGEDLRNAEPGVIYAGGLSRIRNIKPMIEAVGRLQDPGVPLHLFGPWETDDLRSECSALQGWNTTHYWGFREVSEVYNFLQAKGHVGLILFDPDVKNHRIALPNKAFEYMAAGVPIVMSDIPYWRQEFEGAALFVNPSDPDAIADAIRRVLEDAQLSEQLIKRGKTTVEELNWEREKQRLFDLYQGFLA